MLSIQATHLHEGSGLGNLNIEEIAKKLARVVSRNSLAIATKAVTADTTLTHENAQIIADTSGGNIALTLPYANSWGSTKTPILIVIKGSESNTLTITTQGTDYLAVWNGANLEVGTLTVKGIVVLVSDGSTGFLAITGDGTTATSGTYTPTLYNSTNVAASTAVECQYMRVGNVVTVSGLVLIDPTAAAISTILGMSLPIASAMTAAEQLAGTCANTTANDAGSIYGDSTNDIAIIETYPTGTGNVAWALHFTYRIL